MASDDQELLKSRMEKIRTRRLQAVDSSKKGSDSPGLRSLRSSLKKVVDQFVSNDKQLAVQSSDAQGFFVGFAAFQVIRVTFGIEGERVLIQSQDGRADKVVYAGDFDEKAIENAVRDTLVDWYASLF